MNTELPQVSAAFAAYLASSKDLAELYKRILELVGNLGFSDYCFIRYELSTPEVVLVTNPVEQLQAYTKARFAAVDLALQYMFSNNKPILLSEIYGVAENAPFSIEPFTANKKIFELSKAFGYLDYYCVPIQTARDKTSAMFCVSLHRACTERIQAKAASQHLPISMLGKAVNHVINVKFPGLLLYSDRDKSVALKKKSLTVLDAVANLDLQLSQIADRLCMSLSSVNQHLAAAKGAFNCKRTHRAVLEARRLGLIEFT